MARVSRDDLQYCRMRKECVDCHLLGTVKAAEVVQVRGKFKVPSCRLHFYAYKSKISHADAQKYLRSCETKRQAGRCVYKGCHHKLIPSDVLPPWLRKRRTCGMHGAVKAFRINGTALLRLITERCLSDEEREGTLHDIIYKSGWGYVLLGLQFTNSYRTTIYAATPLLKECEEIRRR